MVVDLVVVYVDVDVDWWSTVVQHFVFPRYMLLKVPIVNPKQFPMLVCNEEKEFVTRHQWFHVSRKLRMKKKKMK